MSETNKTNKLNKIDKIGPSSSGKSLVGFLILAAIVIVAYLFISGRLIFIETLRLPGETRGYFGQNRKLLEDPESLEKIFAELGEKDGLDGDKTKVYSVRVNNRNIHLTVKDSNRDDYYDDYRYNGTALVFPRWSNIGPNKTIRSEERFISLSEVNAHGMSKFHSKIQDFVKENNIKIKDSDGLVTISIQQDIYHKDRFYLNANIRGDRKDYEFDADMSGEEFEYSSKSDGFSDKVSYVDSEEKIRSQLDKLADVDMFSGESVIIRSMMMGRDSSRVVAQNPQKKSELYSLWYRSGSMLEADWLVDGPEKNTSLGIRRKGKDTVELSNLSAKAIHGAHQKVIAELKNSWTKYKTYLDEDESEKFNRLDGDIERLFYDVIHSGTYVRYDYQEEAVVIGVGARLGRESVRFVADIDGGNFRED